MMKRVAKRVGREFLVFALAIIAAVGLLFWETHGFTDRPQWMEAWQLAASAKRITD